MIFGVEPPRVPCGVCLYRVFVVGIKRELLHTSIFPIHPSHNVSLTVKLKEGRTKERPNERTNEGMNARELGEGSIDYNRDISI